MEKRENLTDRLVGPEGVVLLVNQDIGGITGAKQILLLLLDHLNDTGVQREDGMLSLWQAREGIRKEVSR